MTTETKIQYECTLTTVDNPFDPFEDFNNWFLFDIEKGYNTCSILGRIANLEEGLSQIETNREIERAIDTFIANDFTDMFKKVSRKVKYD